MLVMLLTLLLAFNAFGFAYAADGGVELALEFEDVLSDDEIAQTEESAPKAEDEIVYEEIEEDVSAVVEPAEAEDAELLDAAAGQNVAPGTIFVYNNTIYKIKDDAVNIVDQAGDGSFTTAPSIYKDDDTSTRTDHFINTSQTASYDATEGHNAPGSLKWSSGVLIWRHTFETGKLYIYSMWYKFTGTADLDDSQRHLAGANDVAGGTHSNPLTNDGTETWQQDWCVFEGNAGEDKFLYAQLSGSGEIYIDDFYIYEVEKYDAFQITSNQLERQSDLSVVSVPASGFSASGEYYHVVNYENLNVTDYTVTGVVALMKDDKLVKIFASSTRTNRGKVSVDGSITPAIGTVDIWFEIPELEDGEDISQYSYMAYIVTEGNPFGILGSVSDENPVIVKGV